MKCKVCGGAGVIQGQAPGLVSCCPACDGKGFIEQTNEEWRKTCSVEEFAEFLCNVGFENETIVRKFKSEWERWLKQPHTNE